MSLQSELARIRTYLTDTVRRPSNEANTRTRVLYPLLQQCGYDHHDIDEESHNGAGGYPDYALLPGTPQMWFLEAKDWNISLTDSHVVQALTYANAKGKRWVVLSNGREWRLYDNYIVNVPPPDRLAATARLDCGEEVEAFLRAMSKGSVLSEAVELYALQTRLTQTLYRQLQDSSSNVATVIASTLKKMPGLTAARPNDVVVFFQSLIQSAISSGMSQPQQVSQPLVSPPATATVSSFTLSQLLTAGTQFQGRKPEKVTFPDMNTKTVSSWRDVALCVIEWLCLNVKMPVLPFRGREGGQRYFISITSYHADGKVMTATNLAVKDQTLYVDVNRSSADFVGCLNKLCEQTGQNSSDFLITLR